MKRFFPLLLFLSSAGCSITLAKPIILNGTAATVGKHLVTVQDARFYRALQRFQGDEADVFKVEEGEELRRTVQKIVLEEMVATEMKSFQATDVRPEAEKLIR